MSDILNKNITIQAVEQKTAGNGNPFIKIQDELGLRYTMWQTKKDGTEQKSFSYFKTLGFEATGKTVSIGYKEEQGEYEGKPVTYRTIIGMREAGNYPAPQAPQAAQAVPQGMEARMSNMEFRLSVLEGKGEAQTVHEAFATTSNPIGNEQPVNVDEIPF